MNDFPNPFGGCDYQVKVNQEEMLTVLEDFGNHCYDNHYHNIAVQIDGGYIYTSELGVKCIYKALGRSTDDIHT